MKEINETLKNYKLKAAEQIDLINEFIAMEDEEKDPVLLQKILKNEIFSIRTLRQLTLFLPDNYPLSEADSSRVVFTIEKEDNLYRIVMNELLPRRLDVADIGKSAIKELRQIYADNYRTSLNEYRKDHNIYEFKSPVIALFINYYSCASNIMDCDNVDTKIFTDNVISAVFIPDDNPAFLTEIICSKAGETDHTEILIGKASDILAVCGNLINE